MGEPLFKFEIWCLKQRMSRPRRSGDEECCEKATCKCIKVELMFRIERASHELSKYDKTPRWGRGAKQHGPVCLFVPSNILAGARFISFYTAKYAGPGSLAHWQAPGVLTCSGLHTPS